MRRTIRAAVIAAAVVLIGLVVAPVAAQNQCPEGWQAVWSDGRRTATIDDADLLEVWNFFESESDGRILANGIDIGAAPVENDATVVLPLPEGDGPWLITATGRASVCVRGITTTSATTSSTTLTTQPAPGSSTTSSPPTTRPEETTTTATPPPTTPPTSVPESTTSTSVPPTTTTSDATGNVVPICDGLDVWVSDDATTWELAAYTLDGERVELIELASGGLSIVDLPPGEYRVVLVVDGQTQVDAVVTIEDCDEPPTTVAPPPELPRTGISLPVLGGVALLLLSVGVALEGLTREGVE